jgi:hypothetical protein
MVKRKRKRNRRAGHSCTTRIREHVISTWTEEERALSKTQHIKVELYNMIRDSRGRFELKMLSDEFLS